MNIHDIIKHIQNYWHSLTQTLKPALDYAESKGGEDVLALAETVLAGFAANESWAVILAEFIKQAIALGKDLAQQDAAIILNLAKANVLAKQAIGA